jgi:hypothetical protein
MAIDQHGNTYHDLGPRPRKALLERFGRKSAKRMYVDTKTREAVHIGWIIAGHWLEVYRVERIGG